VSPTVVQPSRRAQRRLETISEIKTRAMDQIADLGVAGLSLNALARSMSMAPAALYRYFDSKDDLLAELVVDAYDSLAVTVETSAATPAATPTDRLAAVARAYRGWAVAHPNAYRLIFENTTGSGLNPAPDRTLAAAQRSMDVFLNAVAPLRPAASHPLDATLNTEIAHWGERAGTPGLPVPTLAFGLLCWTRLHGLISLELGHHLAATGIDPSRLYNAEVQTLLNLVQPAPHNPTPPPPTPTPTPTPTRQAPHEPATRTRTRPTRHTT